MHSSYPRLQHALLCTAWQQFCLSGVHALQHTNSPAVGSHMHPCGLPGEILPMLRCHCWKWSCTAAASAQAAASHPARGHILPLSSPARPEGAVPVEADLQGSLHLGHVQFFDTCCPQTWRSTSGCSNLNAARCVQQLTCREDKSSTGSCRSLCICCPLRHLLRIRKLKGRPGPRKGRSSGMTCTQAGKLTGPTSCGSK